MKNGVIMSGLSDAELLEKAANNKLNSQPETEELAIQGSPFKLIKENEKWFAAWGQGKMTEDFDTPEKVLEWIENNYWNFMITVLTMAMDSRDLYKIDQMVKHQKRLENAAKKEKEAGEKMDKEYTLHGEIERLKEKEAMEEKLIEVKDEYANKLGYKTYQ